MSFFLCTFALENKAKIGLINYPESARRKVILDHAHFNKLITN